MRCSSKVNLQANGVNRRLAICVSIGFFKFCWSLPVSSAVLICLNQLYPAMNFLEQELNNISQEGQSHQNNYDDFCGPIPRRTTLFHTLLYLIDVKNHYNNLPPEDKVLKTEHVRNVREEDSSAWISKVISQKFKEILAEKEEGQQLDQGDIFWLVLTTFKGIFICTVAFNWADAACRLAFSALIIYLFQAVIDHNTQIAYIYIAILTVLWYLSQLFKQSGCILTYTLASNIKAGLAMLLYSKISKTTSYVMKSSELGKITNLLSNDLGVIEQRMITIMMSTSFPVMLIGITTILIIRIGWVGIIGIVMILLIIPFSKKISEKNGETIQKVNQFKDRRVQITTETIEGIKYIKLYGWEIAFKRIIQAIRIQEMDNLKKLALGRAIERALGNSISLISSVIMFVVAHYANTELSFAKIFSTLEIMTSLRLYTFLMVLALGLYYELKVVFDRFASIFNIEPKSMVQIDESTKKIIPNGKANPDLDNSKYSPLKDWNSMSFLYEPIKKNQRGTEEENAQKQEKGKILFQHFNGYWKEEFQTPWLKDINFLFTPGHLYGITGKVGSGKSGLLGAILSELPFYSGKLAIEGTIAYVEQEPIVFSDTVKNNVIFGRNYNKLQYDKAIELSCMDTDLKLLEKGEETIVGEKGITLSGGQKARLALARAIYTQADIYLLDDPISAVDAKVAKIIFNDCIRQLAKESTVILVTHQLSYISECDQVIIMEGGAITAAGGPSEVQNQLQLLSQAQKKEEESEGDDNEPDVDEEEEKLLLKVEEVSSESQVSLTQKTCVKEEGKDDSLENRFLEKNAEVTLGTYYRFLISNKINYIVGPLVLVFFLMAQGITTTFFRFLADYDHVANGTSGPFGHDFSLYWGILVTLVVAYFLMLALKYFTLNMAMLLASTSVHEKMIQAIVRSPGSFFDSTPSGILVNKFSNDLGVIDNSLVFACIDALEGPIIILVAIVNMAQINFWILIPAGVILVIAIMFFWYARPVISGCKQLDLQSKNPIFHFYGETISGLVQIRVYNQRLPKLQQFSHIINRSSKASICFDMVSRGFGFYSTIGSIALMFFAMILGVVSLREETRTLYGVTVIYLITICDLFQWILRQIITAESLMVSAQRILEFEHFQKENELRTPYDREVGLAEEVEAAQRDEDLHHPWPDNPSLEVKNLSARYREGLPLVLKRISFKAGPGEKIGIVGRTGAGKSSIIQALFRIFEPEVGSSYQIGSADALGMGLHSLRQHISVIPQVPFLFKGTVKQNVDPFDTASQEQVWLALEESGLLEHVQSLQKQLQTDISNNSESFSVGQKQLLCLARALLRRNRFLVLDEATSNVDMNTDAFIQKVIQKRFKDTTVITIAHRLNTIANYDRVIAMHRGRIVEQGSPYELLERKGLFYDMVQHTGKHADLIRNKAKESFKIKRRNTIR